MYVRKDEQQDLLKEKVQQDDKMMVSCNPELVAFLVIFLVVQSKSGTGYRKSRINEEYAWD